MSVGESKLCQTTVAFLCTVVRTRLPVFMSLSCNWKEEKVVVDQIVIFPASVRTMLPLFLRESFEPLPLTGWSRLAVQTTVGCLERVNQTEKEKALSPTWKKPAVKSPLDDTRVSFCFSTERDEAWWSVSVAVANRGRRRNTMIFIFMEDVFDILIG